MKRHLIAASATRGPYIPRVSYGATNRTLAAGIILSDIKEKTRKSNQMFPNYVRKASRDLRITSKKTRI